MSIPSSNVTVPPPAKRRREESKHQEVKKSESIYFENRDIVLLSLPEGQVITAFKVDKIYLLRASPVFEGMFSLPSPDAVEKYDNVPLVRLQEEAGNLASFLKALYDPSSIPTKKYNRGFVELVEGLLKIANKYQVGHLRQRIVDILSADWPSDLRSWDANEAEISSLNYSRDSAVDPFMDNTLPESCSTIRLARDCDIPSILPAAFYHLSRIPIVAHRGNNLIDDEVLGYFSGGGRSAAFQLLTSEDLLCLMKGSYAVTDYFNRCCLNTYIVCQVGANHASRESPAKNCWKPLQNFMDRYKLRLTRERDPLAIMQRDFRSISEPDDLCTDCAERFRRKLHSWRGKLWNRLPVFFGLANDIDEEDEEDEEV